MSHSDHILKNSGKMKKTSCKESPDHTDPVMVFARRFQAFFESTYDAIGIFNDEGEILDANPRFLSLTGLSYEKLTLLSIEDIFDAECCRRIRKRTSLLFENQKRKTPVEGTLRSSGNKKKSVEIILSLLRQQYGYSKTVLAFIRDITHRKRLKQRLINRVEELQKVFDAVPNLLLVLDKKRKIRRVNRAGIHYVGKKTADVLNEDICMVLGCAVYRAGKQGGRPDLRCKDCMIMQAVDRSLENGEHILDQDAELISGKDKGSVLYFRINSIPMEMNSSRWCVLSMADVTERVKKAMETRRLNESISRANLELKHTLDKLAQSQSKLMESQKLEQIGLLASGLAHNLRTPLGGIKGYTQLLKLDHKELDELDIIIREVEKMESIISNLTLKSRKGHRNREEWLSLNELLDVELDFLSANLFFKHSVTKKIRLDKNLPMIRGVYSHFSQAILNLIQNALDAMYQSKKKVLTIKTRHDQGNIYVDIQDTGCGIPEHIRDKIFDVFFTTKPPIGEIPGDEPHGTGLGLSSAASFIAQYGGRIHVNSREGKGTKMTIEIPQQKMDENKRSNRILIVEDSQTVLNMVSQLCREMGLETYGVDNGEKALDIYRRIRPDLVVTDLVLPGMTGKDLMGCIHREHPQQRVIYITGYAENPEFQEWLDTETRQHSMRILVRKPFRASNMKALIARMLDA